MPTLADALTPRAPRDQLLRLVADAAINDAAFRQRLIEDPSGALRLLFGREPPSGYDFRVVVEDASTYYFVIPEFGRLRKVAAPPTIAPRSRFESRLNSILRRAPGRIEEFEAHPREFIANTLSYRLPSTVTVVPVREHTDPATGEDVVYLVLKHPPHDMLFADPFALRFARETSAATVAPSDSLDTPDAVSVETWFRADDFSPESLDDAVVSRHGQGAGFELRVGGAIPRFMVTVGGEQHCAEPASPKPLLVPGRWYYVAGVYTGTDLELHLDGAYMYGRKLSGALDQDPGPLVVGAARNPAWEGRSFMGEVDEVRVRGRGLGADEIRETRRRGRTATPEPDGTLRLYFPCSEGNGTVVHDHSRNRNDGTLTDVDWVSTGGAGM